MNELLDKLQKLKTPQKIGLTLGLMVVVGAMYNFMFLVDLEDEIKNYTQQREQLATEKASYEKRRIEFLAYKQELTKLQEEQREILKILPKNSELGSFYAALQQQAELSGVEVKDLTPEAEIPDELYVKIPAKLEVLGTYHAISRFFKNIGEMARIMNVENFSLVPERAAAPGQGDSGGRVKLKCKFTAVAYRFQDQPGAPGGTP